ncbi:MAG: 50S ribosomal protein L23 [Candidatus Brocadiaceae bacterium]|jgi:large subunit ribosomal protein L23
MDSHHVIVRPLHTEKSVDDIRQSNAYHFEVHPEATKKQIRHAVEELFPDCRVTDVRTLWVKGKSRRVRYNVGRTSNWKKAIVALRPGET